MNATPNNDDFVDPLENYDAPTYADALEEAICEQPASKVQHEPFTTIPASATVEAAVKKLAGDHLACLMVEENDKLVGLFTNREVLNKVALEPEILDQPVREVMTPDPVYVREDDPVAAALCVMAVHGYRHVPILKGDESIYGIISPQRITNFLIQYVFASEA